MDQLCLRVAQIPRLSPELAIFVPPMSYILPLAHAGATIGFQSVTDIHTYIESDTLNKTILPN